MTVKLPSITDVGNTPDSIAATLRTVKEAINLLGLNAAGVKDKQIFALAGNKSGLSCAAVGSSATATATVQISPEATSTIAVAYHYYGTAAGGAGSLSLTLDGNIVGSVPLPVVGGQVYPQLGLALLANVGAGPHSLSASTSNGAVGVMLLAIGFSG